MLRKLYDFTLAQADRPYAQKLLAIVAFLESSVFPIPPDVLLIPMVLANRKKAWLIAGICTLASVLGGLAGYLIGALLFETIGAKIVEFYHLDSRFESFSELYNRWGVWIILVAGITPIPYKVFTIASGVTGLNLWIFLVFSLIARGFRFFLVTFLLWRWGEPIKAFIERYLGWLTLLFFVLLFGAFFLLR